MVNDPNSKTLWLHWTMMLSLLLSLTLLWTRYLTVDGWLSQPQPLLLIARRRSTTRLPDSVFFRPPEEEECGEEEACEIDWDNMPGFEEEQQEEAQVAEQELTDHQRLRLEMMWGVAQAAEDCDIEHPDTCGSQPCQDCHGRGQRECRFCHGRGTLMWMRTADDGDIHAVECASSAKVEPCRICQTLGVETCSKCKGTGWVAEWTMLSGSAR